MIELETPQQPQAPDPHIEEVHADGNLSRFEVTPLQEGYGMTLGNGLRRVLLSSLEGAAVTGIQIHGVFHEFSTIQNVKEDVTQIVLNVKKLRLRSFARHAVTLKLVKRGAGAVTGPAPRFTSLSVTAWRAKERRRSFLTFSTIWVTSSLTFGIVLNSWKTPAIWMLVTAAPSRELRRTRRSELPSVTPYPSWRGLTSKWLRFPSADTSSMRGSGIGCSCCCGVSSSIMGKK
jgi:hypothetical protein